MTIEAYSTTDRALWLARRRRDLTASDLGALVGVDRFRTPYAIYAEKTGEIPPAEENDSMRRGRWLEPAILLALREQYPTWRIEQANVYLRDSEIRLGCTPDFVAEDPAEPETLINIQGKTTSPFVFERDWSDDQAPIGYQLQTLCEGMLMGAGRCLLAVLVVDPYNADLHLREIERHAGAEARIRQLAIDFWSNIEAGRRPVPDYERDGETIAAMFPRHEPGKVLDLSGDNRLAELLAKHAAHKVALDAHDEVLKEIEAEIKLKIGDAEAAELPGWRLTWKTENRKGYSVAPSTRRPLRIKHVEEKEQAA